MKWYVYRLIDPRDRATFYIGKGCGSRIDAHERDATKMSGNLAKCQRIRDIWRSGHEITKEKIAYFYNEQDAYGFEGDLIRSTKGLTNGTKPENKGVKEVLQLNEIIESVWLLRKSYKFGVGWVVHDWLVKAIFRGHEEYVNNRILEITNKYGNHIWQHEIVQG